jgi:hypothetical protein
MDAKKIIEKLKGENDRERTSLYLSRSTMQKFKDSCVGIAPSRVMELLMEDFVNSHINDDLSDKIEDKAVIKSLKSLAMALGYEIKKIE